MTDAEREVQEWQAYLDRKRERDKQHVREAEERLAMAKEMFDSAMRRGNPTDAWAAYKLMDVFQTQVSTAHEFKFK